MNTYDYEGEQGENGEDDGVQKVIDLFCKNGNLEQYCDAVRKQQISIDVLLSMTKDEIKETLNIQVFGHLRELELLLEKTYPGKNRFAGQRQVQQVQIQRNVVRNPLVNNPLVGNQNHLIGQQMAINNANNALAFSNNILGGVQQNGCPVGVTDMGNGQYEVNSTNAFALMGLIFFCIGLFIGVVMVIAMSSFIESVLFVLITPMMFVIMGLIFTKGGTATRKWITTLDDSTRLITIKKLPVLPCCMSAPRKIKYDDVAAVNIVRTNMAVNRQPVKNIQLNCKNGIRPAILGTTTSWWGDGGWKAFMEARIASQK